ncbi:MAG TPA: hypothetical protein VEA59_02585 [Patescibacteria group bacterium]|nr:hypothetical protein [Patescibacteria group bacterium]
MKEYSIVRFFVWVVAGFSFGVLDWLLPQLFSGTAQYVAALFALNFLPVAQTTFLDLLVTKGKFPPSKAGEGFFAVIFMLASLLVGWAVWIPLLFGSVVGFRWVLALIPTMLTMWLGAKFGTLIANLVSPEPPYEELGKHQT